MFAAPGLKLAEWPDKVPGLLPVPDLRVDIAIGDGVDEGADDTRHVTIQALTPAGVALLA